MDNFIRELILELAKSSIPTLFRWLGVMIPVIIFSVVLIVLIYLGIYNGEITYIMAIGIVTPIFSTSGIAVFIFAIKT